MRALLSMGAYALDTPSRCWLNDLGNRYNF
ncbi:YsgD/CorL family protein [Chania multitudinisentens]